MNNKGQSLVIFVLILPIIVMFVALLINSGLAYYNKTKITGSVESNLKIILEQDIKDEMKIKNVLEKNLKNEDIDIKIVDNFVYVMVKTENDYLFERLLSGTKEINYNYVGNYDNDTYELK